MTHGTASYREDGEQLRWQFEEFRRTHAGRSRLPEGFVGRSGEVARRDGVEANLADEVADEARGFEEDHRHANEERRGPGSVVVQ